MKQIILTICIAGGILSTACMHAGKAYEDAVINYEEYREIYQTTQKINTDLCSMRELPEKDIMFAQFSKPQRIQQMKQNLNRWIEDYNAKSKMINRSIWKSSELPYQLSVTQFNCYN